MQYELHHIENGDALVPPNAARVCLVVRHGDTDWRTRPLPELVGHAPCYGKKRLMSEETLRKVFTDDSDAVLRDVAAKGYALIHLRGDYC